MSYHEQTITVVNVGIRSRLPIRSERFAQGSRSCRGSRRPLRRIRGNLRRSGWLKAFHLLNPQYELVSILKIVMEGSNSHPCNPFGPNLPLLTLSLALPLTPTTFPSLTPMSSPHPLLQ